MRDLPTAVQSPVGAGTTISSFIVALVCVASGCPEVHRPAAADSQALDAAFEVPPSDTPMDASDTRDTPPDEDTLLDEGFDSSRDAEPQDEIGEIDDDANISPQEVLNDADLPLGEVEVSEPDDGETDTSNDATPEVALEVTDDAGPDTPDTGEFDPEGTNGTFYCVGYAGLYMRSTDLGLTWDVLEDQGSGGDDPTLYRNIHYLNGVYFRVGNAGRGFWVSTDGQTWTDYSLDTGVANQWVGGVAYGNGRWVAAGGCGITFTSTDAENWSFIYNAPEQDGCEHARTIAFGGGTFVTLGNNGPLAYWATTTDGDHFANYQTTDTYGWHTVEYAFGKFWVSLNDGSEVMTSADGAAFSAQAGIPEHTYRQLSFWAGRLLIPTSSGVLLESTDGSTFTSINAPALARVVYGGGVYIGAGSSGTLQRTDDDGQTWANVNPTSHAVQRCIYAP